MGLYLLRLSVPAAFCLAGAVLLTVGAAGQGNERIPAPWPGIDGEAGSPASIELGRLLFWDPILSGNKDTACATCHHPDFTYGDGRDLSLGTGSVGLGPLRSDVSNGRIPTVKRNAPTILNTAFNGLDAGRGRRRNAGEAPRALVNQSRAPMLWDSRIRSLETQALEPIKTREEMRGDAYTEETAVSSVVTRLRENREYTALFKAAFGPETAIDAWQLGRAIAAFERSLVAMNGPFDRFRGGDLNALTAQQRRGMEAFDNAGCDRCHEGAMFSDFELHAEGVKENPKLAAPDAGTRRFRFRTPSLRNVALTAPYMHNGMLASLEDVLRFYDNGRSENPNVTASREGRRRDDAGVTRLAGQFQRVDDMSEVEMRDIVAFLQALSDPVFDRTIPSRVPSGLTPGGAIRARTPLASTAVAHHSVLGQFDLSKSITLKGTIAKVDWINPHPYVHLNVREPNGTVTVWALSTIPIAMMRKAGITKETLSGRPGEIVTIAAHPAQNGRRMAWVTRITYADGHFYALFEE